MNIIRSLLIALVLPVALSASYFKHEQPGLIHGAVLKYLSTTTVTITPGYGESNGEYWEIAPGDALTTTGYSLANLSSSTNGYLSYIYISSTSSFPLVTLSNTTSAPIWSDSTQGWYNNNDRCIGVVFVGPSGIIYGFDVNDNNEYITCPAQLVLNGPVRTTYPPNLSLSEMNFLNASNYIPVNATSARLGIFVTPGSNWSEIHIYSADSSYSTEPYNTELSGTGSIKAQATGNVPLGRNTTRAFYWYAWSSVNNNSSQIWLFGWRLSR